MRLSTSLIAYADVKPKKIEDISDAINYLGYNDNLVLTVPDIQENNTPYILPVENEEGYSKKMLSIFEGLFYLCDTI